MQTVLIRDLSGAYTIPPEIRTELVGLRAPVARPTGFKVVGPPTVQTESVLTDYQVLCANSFAIDRDELMQAAEIEQRYDAAEWLGTLREQTLLFPKFCCTVDDY